MRSLAGCKSFVCRVEDMYMRGLSAGLMCLMEYSLLGRNDTVGRAVCLGATEDVPQILGAIINSCNGTFVTNSG
jgi:hypothetical protein